MKIPLIIPSYKPDERFLTLIKAFIEVGFTDIIVIRDGGGLNYDSIFECVLKIKNVTLLIHAVNLGKGRALKTAFNYVLLNRKDVVGCVTVDADGQHLPKDAFAVAEMLEKNPNTMVLGVRKFDKEVPFRSKFGNILTRYVFLFLTGLKLSDTQTGLRGIPMKFLSILMSIHGERYEYETNMLLASRKSNIKISEVDIDTVYIESNRGSHFNPLWDSMKIYFILLRYAFSGIFSAVLDFALFSCFFIMSEQLFISILSARLLALGVNYTLNKKYVFASDTKNILAFPKFLLLCALSFALSYSFIYFLQEHGYNVYLAKILIEVFLFFANFAVQRLFIFNTYSSDDGE